MFKFTHATGARTYTHIHTCGGRERERGGGRKSEREWPDI